jgi:hypothetical protein
MPWLFVHRYWGQSACVHSLRLFLLVALCGTLHAQVPDLTTEMATPIPGVGHHYLGLQSDLLTETVNPTTGSVSVHISLPIATARGLTLPVDLMYNSSGINQLGGPTGNAVLWRMDDGYYDGVGWTYSLPILTVAYNEAHIVSGDGTGGGTSYTCPYLTNYTFQAPDGSRHDMNLSLVPDPSAVSDCANFFSLGSKQNGGDDVYSATTQPIVGNYSQTGGFVSPVTITDHQGTTYHFSSSNFQYVVPTNGNSSAGYYALPDTITDRNGNVTNITFLNGAITYKDSTGRTALAVSAIDTNTNNSTVAVDGFSSPAVANWGITSATFSNTPSQVLIGDGPTGCYSQASASSRQTKSINSFALPNGSTFTFEYDSTYGLLKKINFPNGGYIQYMWDINPLSEILIYNDNAPDYNIYCEMRYGTPAVSKRVVSYDGTTIAETQNFTYSTTWPNDSFQAGTRWTGKTTTVDTIDNARGETNWHAETVYHYTPGHVPTPWNTPNQIGGDQFALESSIEY